MSRPNFYLILLRSIAISDFLEAHLKVISSIILYPNVGMIFILMIEITKSNRFDEFQKSRPFCRQNVDQLIASIAPFLWVCINSLFLSLTLFSFSTESTFPPSEEQNSVIYTIFTKI